MSRRKTSTQAGAGKGQAARQPRILLAARSQRQSSAKGDALLPRMYRELIRQHLDKLLGKLFAEFTGVHFHIAWTPDLPRQWNARTLPTGCSVCCRLVGAGPQPPAECRTCGPNHLAAALQAERGHRFTCRLGLYNYWCPIRVRSETLGIAYLQALDKSAARLPGRKRSTRAARPLRRGHAAARDRLRRADVSVLTRWEFLRATRFLQHIVQHVQASSLSDLRKADLTSAGQVVLALEKEQARLHEALQRHLPPPPQASHRAAPESHPEQIVQRLLERIQQDYGKPITLTEFAREQGMNAAYLSDLFSHVVGVPFKTYLTDLRMAKAKALLGDPAKTASEVADAVGYASEARFRRVFRKATGLCPRLWRQTMRMAPATAVG